MGWLIVVGVLPVCLLVAWCILRRPLRMFFEDIHVDQARELFRSQRERLEARFVSSLSSFDLEEGRRWEDAHWHDEVLWARDRKTRCLLALVYVHFDPDLFDLLQLHRHATAVFEFRKGRWHAEGKRLDQVLPDEAVGRNRRFEPVATAHHNPRRVG